MPQPILEKYRLRFSEPSVFPSIPQKFLKTVIDQHFMHTLFDYTAGTYCTTVIVDSKSYIIEVDPKDMPWDLKKTATRALVLASIYFIPGFILNRKVGGVFCAAYLSLPLVSMLLSTRNTDLYEDLKKTREALKEDLTKKLNEINAARTRLGLKALTISERTETFESRRKFLGTRAAILNDKSEGDLKPEIEELEKQIQELEKAAGEQKDIITFKNKLDGSTDTIVSLKTGLEKLKSNSSSEVKIAAKERLENPQFKKRFSEKIKLYFEQFETVKKRFCLWYQFCQDFSKKNPEIAKATFNGEETRSFPSPKERESFFDKTFQVETYKKFKNLDTLDVYSLDDKEIELLTLSNPCDAETFTAWIIGFPEGFENATEEEATAVIDFFSKEENTKIEKAIFGNNIEEELRMENNPFCLRFSSERAKKVVQLSVISKVVIEIFELCQKFQKRMEDEIEKPQIEILKIIKGKLSKDEFDQYVNVSLNCFSAGGIPPPSELPKLMSIFEKLDRENPDLIEKIQPMQMQQSNMKTPDQIIQEIVPQLIEYDAFFVLYSQGHWQQVDIDFLRQMQQKFKLTNEEMIACMEVQYSELKFEGPFLDIVLQDQMVDVDAQKKLLAVIGYMISKVLAKKTFDSLSALIDEIKQSEHQTLLYGYNHLQFARWMCKQLKVEETQTYVDFTKYAKQVQLDIEQAWIVIHNMESKPKDLKQALCDQLKINQDQFDSLVKGEIDKFKIEDPS